MIGSDQIKVIVFSFSPEKIYSQKKFILTQTVVMVISTAKKNQIRIAEQIVQIKNFWNLFSKWTLALVLPLFL